MPTRKQAEYIFKPGVPDNAIAVIENVLPGHRYVTDGCALVRFFP